MNAVINLGKYLFAIPFLIFGIFHFMSAGDMAAMAPFGGEIIVYITGVCLILASISIIIGKYDKLAAVLLALMILLFALLVHGRSMMNAGDDMAKAMSMSAMLKDLVIVGAALIYAKIAKDNSIIG